MYTRHIDSSVDHMYQEPIELQGKIITTQKMHLKATKGSITDSMLAFCYHWWSTEESVMKRMKEMSGKLSVLQNNGQVPQSIGLPDH